MFRCSQMMAASDELLEQKLNSWRIRRQSRSSRQISYFLVLPVFLCKYVCVGKVNQGQEQLLIAF